jgi:D-aminopeptidase
MYEEGRKLYTGEINAAVRGAKAAGATEIVVMDCVRGEEGARADRTRREARARLKAVAPYDPGTPREITVDFNTSDHVERYRFRPGIEITEPRQIVSRADDWWSAWKQFFF